MFLFPSWPFRSLQSCRAQTRMTEEGLLAVLCMEYSPTSFLEFFKILCYQGNHFIFSFHHISFVTETSVKTLKIKASIITIFQLTLKTTLRGNFNLYQTFTSKANFRRVHQVYLVNKIVYFFYVSISGFLTGGIYFFPSNFVSRKILSGIVGDNA